MRLALRSPLLITFLQELAFKLVRPGELATMGFVLASRHRFTVVCYFSANRSQIAGFGLLIFIVATRWRRIAMAQPCGSQELVGFRTMCGLNQVQCQAVESPIVKPASGGVVPVLDLRGSLLAIGPLALGLLPVPPLHEGLFRFGSNYHWAGVEDGF